MKKIIFGFFTSVVVIITTLVVCQADDVVNGNEVLTELEKKVVLAQDKSNKVTLRVAVWNIWKNNVVNFGEPAMAGTIGILKKLEADVILMLETEADTKSTRAERIARELGGFYYHFPNYQTNLCIFSRYPILEKYGSGGLKHLSSYNLTGVKIDIDGVHVRLFDAWLHYLPSMKRVISEKTPKEIAEWEVYDWVDKDGYAYGSRDEEINEIITVLKPYLEEVNTVPVILGGDLNALSHLDWTKATKNMYGHGGKVVDWKISNIVANAGFKDSYREMYPNPATHPGTTHAGSGDKGYNRIDYIHYQGETIKLVDSKIYKSIRGGQVRVKGENFFFGSDHGLVFSTFDIDRGTDN